MDQLFALLILYCIIGTLCWYVITSDNKFIGSVKTFLNLCVTDCHKCGTFLGKKGDNYYLDDKGVATNPIVKHDDCMLTMWNMSHFVTHAIAGFIAPDYFLLDFLIGTGFEVYEGAGHECQDPTDIVCNVLGFVSGKYIHEQYYQKV